MTSEENISRERLQQLLKTARLGWWKADFHNQNFTCSDFIIQLLGIENEILSFEEFQQCIRADYRDRITEEFISIPLQAIYEQTFPVSTPVGENWVSSKVSSKETDAEGHLIVWGFLQCVTNPEIIKIEKAMEKFNIHLHQQNKISRLLLSFLQTEDTTKVIHSILVNILQQYHGSSCYIIEYNWEKEVQNFYFEVNADGVASQLDKVKNLSIHSLPWWTKEMTAHNPIILSHLNQLPAEAQAERDLLELQNIKSLMVIPMIAKDHVWGYMGIDIIDQYREWTHEDYQWFSSLGNIISLCLELYKSKNKAQKEQEYFKNLYAYMPIVHMRIKLLYDASGNINDYQFIDINPAFEHITQNKISGFLGKRAHELYDPTDIDRQLQEIKAIIKKDTYSQVNFQSPLHNQYFRCIVYSPEPDEIVCLFTDYTDIQKAHEALDRSEKELRNLYRNIPVGIEIYDKKGVLRDINKKDMEIFGLKEKEQALGVNLFDNPNIPDEVKQQIREHENVDFKIEYDFKKIKGYYHSDEQGVKDLIVKVSPLYNSNNQLENYILIIIDNTETSTAFSKIQEFENFFSMIADFAKVGYFKWNLYQKTGFALEQWFKNWGESVNNRLEDIIGNYSMLHPDDRPKVLQLYQQLITGQLKGSKEEVRIRDGKGGWKWIRSTVIVTKFDPEHQDIELIGVNFDITELKEIEAKLIEAKNKAETLDKLKSAFLANMSHEIRTPLNAIVGFSNLLAETGEKEEQQQYISIIQENNDLLLQLISDILDLSKIEAGTFEIVYGDVDAYLLCNEIIRSLDIKTAPGVVLELEKVQTDCHFMGDRNRLMQIITNFINNAIKFTNRGSIRLGYEIRNNEIEFYVSDTGIGISEKNLSTVFDRFVKLNSFIHGTGLGLSICKSMVEQMGGRIGVESKEGTGSRFWFVLPYIAPEDNLKQESTPVMHPASCQISKPTLLIAEDTESNFILISTILKKEYNILWAHDGREVVEMYLQHHPDMILMDIRMPGMNGIMATRQIRAKDQHIPIIALTAFAFDSDKAQALEAGCNAYLSKPINTQLLKSTIRELLDEEIRQN